VAVKKPRIVVSTSSGGDGKPSGDAADALATAYGSVEKWQQDCKATSIAARGWVWTAIDFDLGGPFNFIGDAQNTFPVWNALPFIAVDTYEHAYMLDFATGRAAYLDAVFQEPGLGSHQPALCPGHERPEHPA